MAISFFLSLLILGGGVALIATIVIAIASKRLWLIPAVAVALFIGVLMLSALGILYVGASRIAVVESFPQVINTSGMPYVSQVTPSQSNFNIRVESNPAWTKVIFVAGLIAFGAIMLLRRIMSPHGGHGLRRAWPAVAVLGFIGFLMLVRVNDRYERSQLNIRSAQEAAETNLSQLKIDADRQRSTLVAQMQKTEQEKQQRAFKAEQEKQRRAKQAEEETQRRIAHGDINELIELFDQPRIPVSSAVAKAPAPPTPPAPASPPVPVDKSKAAANSLAAEKKKDSKAKSDSVSQKNKRSSKATSTTSVIVEAEPPQLSAATSTDRPAWTNDSPKRTGNTRREVIVTEPYATVDECYQAGDIYLLLKTYQRLEELKGRPTTDVSLPSLTFQKGSIFADGKMISFGPNRGVWNDDSLRYLAGMGIGPDYVRREIVAKESHSNESREYVETVQQSFGPMKKLYLQVEFTPAIDRELMRHWAATQREERFAVFGAGAGTLLTLLALAFALLKFDTFTKGYYTKWLLIGVPTAIIGGIFLFLLVAMH